MRSLYISSGSNPGIKDVAALTQKNKRRKETGLFTAEGVKLFEEAPKELVKEVYVSESFEVQNKELLENVKYIAVRDDIFPKMCDTKTPQGILTVLKQPEYSKEEFFGKEKGAFILILEDVQDPGNVGTIIRTAEGAGVTGVILSGGCADIFSPKGTRSTMGSLFRVPVMYTDDVCDAAKELKKRGIKIYAAHLKGDRSYDEADYAKDCCILIGNEGSGLSDELTALADVLVKIPMGGRLESLNASVAAGILMYEARKQR